MNIIDLNIKRINRIISHQIIAKTKKNDAYSICRDRLLTLSVDEKEILIERLENSLKKTTKSFKLEFKEKNEGSLFDIIKSDFEDDEFFIQVSESISEKLADSHFSVGIPGGICIIGDGITAKNQKFLFVIKAELQEVFNIEEDSLKVIKDVFLSPAKDFYKIGFFVWNGKNIVPFIFDDQFTLQREDLTEYFYQKFAGLTTDQNDALKCKNFHQYTKEFIEKNVSNLKDKIGLQRALRVYFRENVNGVISLKTFADNHLEGDLKNKYIQKYLDKFPTSFTSNLQLINNRLDLTRVSIPFTYQISITGDESSMDNVEVLEINDKTVNERLLPLINNGSLKRIVILKEAEVTEAEKTEIE